MFSLIDLYKDNISNNIKNIDTEVSLPKPFASKRQITNQILNRMKEADQDTLHSLQKMQEQQMDRWEHIINNVVEASSGKIPVEQGTSSTIKNLEARVERIEEQSEEVKEKLDQLLSLVTSKFSG
jgi:uncharacterized protein YceH (UPF0502 family)